ncbi:MAG: pyrroline-5-carboxylate reductase [Anaeroplasmataceae bacterium]
MYKIGLIGYGKMGSSILKGIVSSKLYEAKDILVYNPDLENVIKDGFNTAANELEVYENSKIFIFAIKPQTFPSVMEKLHEATKKPEIVVSIAAGITIDYLEKNLSDNEYVRIMPNLGASINMSVSTMATSKNAKESTINAVKDIFSSIGSVTIVSEDKINTLLPMNGSYPAYFWYFVRSFVRSAVKNGVKEEEVRNMLADASIGCAMMLKSSPKDLDTLINDVCSYKGTTIEGVNVFDECNLDEIVDKCAIACTKRALELEK